MGAIRKPLRSGAETAERSVTIGSKALDGLLQGPAAPRGVVIFAHGSGSSRFSPRNTYVARHLQSTGMVTLLFDLLGEAEAGDRAKVFDIALLADRLQEAVEWARADDDVKNLPIGLFGASTGAAAALVAAANAPGAVRAVVSRGGRPDLAGESLSRVRAPTLLIVGGADDIVLQLNRAALDALACEKALEIVPGATHLFEEPGALDAVIEAAGAWFARHLA